MKIKYIFPLLVLSFFFGLAALQADPSSTTPNSSDLYLNLSDASVPHTDAKPVTIILHQNNDGGKVTVPNGAVVKVILDSQAASTGFDWALAFSSPDVLTFQNKNIQKAPVHLIGGACREVWIFKATAPGQTVLTFSLARSWEKEASPLQTIQFDITVE